MFTVLNILALLIQVVFMLVVVQFIIGLLFAFNVVNSSNEFLTQVYRSIDALLEPVLRPIRRIMPDTGAIDFSPLVLIMGMNILYYIVKGIAG